MKVVLDIETVQAPREEWARLVGKPSEDHGPAPGEIGRASCRERVLRLV